MAETVTNNDKYKELGAFDTCLKKLDEERILFFSGVIMTPFYAESALRLRYLASVNSKPIKIYLNTLGGSLMDALGLYDVMKEIDKTAPLTVIATGGCMSAGMLLLQAPSKRLSLPNTQFMIHELSSQSGGKLSDQRDSQQFETRVQATIDNIIAARAGMDLEEFHKLYQRRDCFLTAKECKRLHLIDGIITI